MPDSPDNIENGFKIWSALKDYFAYAILPVSVVTTIVVAKYKNFVNRLKTIEGHIMGTDGKSLAVVTKDVFNDKLKEVRKEFTSQHEHIVDKFSSEVEHIKEKTDKMEKILGTVDKRTLRMAIQMGVDDESKG